MILVIKSGILFLGDFMARKALIITAVLITILIIVSIIIAITNLKPVTYQNVVSYEPKVSTISRSSSYYLYDDDNELSLLTNLIKYEREIMITAIVLAIIFILVFYGTKRSKGW